MTGPASQQSPVSAPGLVSGLVGVLSSVALFSISVGLTFIALRTETYWLLAVGAALIGVAVYLSNKQGTRGWVGYLAYRSGRAMGYGAALMLAIGCMYWALTPGSTAVASRTPVLTGVDLILGRDADGEIKDFGTIVEADFSVQETFSSVQQFSTNSDAIKLVPAMLAKYPNAKAVEVIARAPLVDKRGNTSMERVMDVTYTRENSEKTNWPKVLPNDLPTIANHYWVHPAVTR